jgi:hypothetical protein
MPHESVLATCASEAPWRVVLHCQLVGGSWLRWQALGERGRELSSLLFYAPSCGDLSMNAALVQLKHILRAIP